MVIWLKDKFWGVVQVLLILPMVALLSLCAAWLATCFIWIPLGFVYVWLYDGWYTLGLHLIHILFAIIAICVVAMEDK